MRKSVPQAGEFSYDVQSKLLHQPTPGVFSVLPVYATAAALQDAAAAAKGRLTVNPRAHVPFALQSTAIQSEASTAPLVASPSAQKALSHHVGATFALPLTEVRVANRTWLPVVLVDASTCDAPQVGLAATSGYMTVRVGAYGQAPLQVVFSGHRTFSATATTQLKTLQEGGLPIELQVATAARKNVYVGAQVSADFLRAGLRAYSVGALYESMCCTYAAGCSLDSQRRVGIYGWWRPFRHSKTPKPDVRFVADFLQNTSATVLAEWHLNKPALDAVGLRVDVFGKQAALLFSKAIGGYYMQACVAAPFQGGVKPQLGVCLTAV